MQQSPAKGLSWTLVQCCSDTTTSSAQIRGLEGRKGASGCAVDQASTTTEHSIVAVVLALPHITCIDN